MLSLPENVSKAASTLITAMDRNGFLGPDPESLLPDDEKPFLADALKAVRSLEPSGVGASDWKESLLLQAEAKGMKGDELRQFRLLVDTQLDNLRSGKTDAIAKALGVEKEDVDAHVRLVGAQQACHFQQYAHAACAVVRFCAYPHVARHVACRSAGRLIPRVRLIDRASFLSPRSCVG